jgi:peroxiredoxin Q/BCP
MAAAIDRDLVGPDGQPFRLSQAWRDGPAVLVFYPGDFTKVCTAQLCDYRDRWAEFRASGATVVGINPEPWQRHAAFAKEHHFPFPVLSDPDGGCIKAYLAKAWWGTRRMVVVIDRAGQERWRKSVMPFTRQSASEVLQAVENAARPQPAG